MNQSIELEKIYPVHIEKVIFGGYGKATYLNKTILVERALEGESLQVKIIENKKKYAKAQIVSILNPSIKRSAPPCLHFNVCQGCQYQHTDYKNELKYKQQQVLDSFSRLKTPFTIQKIISSNQPYHYRQRISVHQQNGQWGFLAKPGFVPIQTCLIAQESLNKIFSENTLKYTKRETFQIDKNENILSTKEPSLYPVQIGNKTIYTHTQNFFQPNPTMIQQLIPILKEHLTPTHRLIDAYAGAGTFSFLLKDNYLEAYCIENSPHSIVAFNKNKEAHPHTPIHFIAKTIEKTIDYFYFKKSSPYILLLDPPRKGLSEKVLNWIKDNQKHFVKIIYLSCHVATQVRDLEYILKNTSYKIKQINPLDFFPRTKHIENLVVLA